MDENTVESVIRLGLCTGCGTCISLCPNDALSLTMDIEKKSYLPCLDAAKCVHCNLCLHICPGKEVDFDLLSDSMHMNGLTDPIIGRFKKCYTGHSKNDTIRNNSTSGGIVTQILLFLLEKNLINGALVTRMNHSNKLEPEPFIARTSEEILEASKSKYCPVPANIALRIILESNEDEKFAVVGLPCQIHAIRKAQLINQKLRKRIILCICIVCSHSDNFHATEYILCSHKIKKDSVKKIEYRGRGWPGSMLIEINNAKNVIIPYKEYSIIHELHMFAPKRCLMCLDGTGHLADISIGDAWGLESIDNRGTSFCISRTDNSEEILGKMAESGYISLNEISSETLIGSQGILFKNRGNFIKNSIRLFNFIGYKIPTYRSKMFDQYVNDLKLINIFKFILFEVNGFLALYKNFWPYISIAIYIQKSIIRRFSLK